MFEVDIERCLVEDSDSNGQVEADAWKVTDAAKERFLVEVDCSTPVENDKNIQKAESITRKAVPGSLA